MGGRVAYQEFIHLLKRIQKKEHEVFLMLAVDSEIDQDLIDEKSWMVKDYIRLNLLQAASLRTHH